jgi:cytochrome c biogenesis protein CcdA
MRTKEAEFQRKHKAKAKANMRLVKNQHRIIPGIALIFVMGAIVGGNVGLLVTDNWHDSALIAVVSGVLAVAFGAKRILIDLTRLTGDE